MTDPEDLLRRNWSFLGSILAGLVLSILTADQQTPGMFAARAIAGLACALIFTDPIVDWLDREPDIYRDATAALLAVSGYAVARVVSNFRLAMLVDLIKAWRGR